MLPTVLWLHVLEFAEVRDCCWFRASCHSFRNLPPSRCKRLATSELYAWALFSHIEDLFVDEEGDLAWIDRAKVRTWHVNRWADVVALSARKPTSVWLEKWAEPLEKIAIWRDLAWLSVKRLAVNHSHTLTELGASRLLASAEELRIIETFDSVLPPSCASTLEVGLDCTTTALVQSLADRLPNLFTLTLMDYNAEHEEYFRGLTPIINVKRLHIGTAEILPDFVHLFVSMPSVTHVELIMDQLFLDYIPGLRRMLRSVQALQSFKLSVLLGQEREWTGAGLERLMSNFQEEIAACSDGSVP